MNVIIPTPPHPTPTWNILLRSIKHVCKSETNILLRSIKHVCKCKWTSSSPPHPTTPCVLTKLTTAWRSSRRSHRKHLLINVSQYSRSSSQCMEEKAKVLSCSATQNDWIIPQVSFADSYSPRFLSRGPKAQEWATRYRHAGIIHAYILKLPFYHPLTMDQLGIALHRNLKTSENVWHQNDQNVSTSA